MNYYQELVKIMIYIALIAVVLYISMKLFKNRLHGQRQGKNMGIIEQLYLGPGKNLSLVKINDRILLLGISQEKVEKIKEWPVEEFPEITAEKPGSFKDYLLTFRRDVDE